MSTETTKINELVAKSKSIGHKEVPASTTELESNLLQFLERRSPDWFTAKELQEIFKEKSPKWFSDKLWNLAGGKSNNGVVQKHATTRGYYRLRITGQK